MAVANDFVSHVLKLEDTTDAILWIAGRPEPRASSDPTAAVCVASLSPYRFSSTGRIERMGDEPGQRIATLVVRHYPPSIIRMTVSLHGATDEPDSPMLEFDPSLDRGRISSGRARSSEQDSRETLEVRGDDGRAIVSFRQGLPATAPWSDLMEPPDEFLDALFRAEHGPDVRLYADNQFFPAMRDSAGLAFLEVDGTIVRTTFALHAEPNETFAGTGERFLEMDLQGRTLDLVNQDALGVNSTRAYKNVPFYLSSRGYGLFVHSSARMTMSLKGVSTRAVTVGVEDEGVDLFLIMSGSPAATLHDYRRLTGFPPELPLWSYGTWMSRMTYFSAREIDEIAARLRAERFPCDVIHIDTGWFDRDWVCEWRFSDERFPDPAGFMRRLREAGYRVSLWQNPNLGAGNRLLADAVARGFVPRPPRRADASGSDFAAAELTGQIDFTNPAAVEWYQGLLADLFADGASVIKTDFGEEIRQDVEYHGMPAAMLQNLYGLLYQRAAFEQTAASTGEPVIWARAGWAGCQRYPLHWGGDAAATWDGLAGSLRGGLHLGLSGFGYWSHDVPGFHGIPDFMNTRPDSELYLRWTQFGVLSSHLRYHGTHPREPWYYPDVAPLVREWLKLRYSLIPYLLREASSMTTSGMPMLRAMMLHHPDDTACRTIDDQYYLGSDLLVAPFIAPGGTRSVYLPAGDWVDFFSGERHTGPVRLAERTWSDAHFPLFVRSGARLPVYPHEVQSTDEMDLALTVNITVDDSYSGLGSSPLGSFIGL